MCRKGIRAVLSFFRDSARFKKTFSCFYILTGGFMTIVEMLGQSGVLTLLGMAVVFGFLFILVIAVSLTGKFIHVAGADSDIQPAAAGGSVPAGTGNAAVTAAISAAVNEYQKTQ
jgi:oxaloacetate decarboxylase gamma subunit